MSPLLDDWDRQVCRQSGQGQDVRNMDTFVLFILKDMLQPTVIGEKQHLLQTNTGADPSDNCFASIFEEQTALKR